MLIGDIFFFYKWFFFLNIHDRYEKKNYIIRGLILDSPVVDMIDDVRNPLGDRFAALFL